MHDRSNVHVTMVQLPGVNTTQFNWCRSKMPDHPQPVPPIYQPEVAADAIHFAANHRRRELWVGGATAVVIAGNKFAPGLGDRYLARTGFSSQQYDGPPPSAARYNLWQPVDDIEDKGAHGAFDARATSRSYELMIAKYKGLLAAGLVAAAVGIGSALWLKANG
jgi:hypothetical protein